VPSGAIWNLLELSGAISSCLDLSDGFQGVSPYVIVQFDDLI